MNKEEKTILSVITVSFRQWILNNMHSAFVEIFDEKIILHLFFYQISSKKELEIINSEIISNIRDNIEYINANTRLPKLVYSFSHNFLIYNDEIKQTKDGWFCIFEKYIYRDYDWE